MTDGSKREVRHGSIAALSRIGRSWATKTSVALGTGLVVVAAVWGVARLVSVDAERTAAELPHPRGPELPLPDPGEVMPAVLEDGFPVFVVRHEDRTTDVFGAVSPHRTAGGAQKALAWCPSSRWFEDLQHGSKFSEWGAYVGGPAPTGLVRYRFRRAGADAIVVEDAEPAPPRGAGRRRSLPAGPSCNVDGVHEPVVHVRSDRALPAPQVLAEDPRDEWRLTDAAVMFADGEVVICDRSQVINDRCPDTALRAEGRDRAGFPGAHLVEGAVLLWISEERVLPPIFLAETAG